MLRSSDAEEREDGRALLGLVVIEDDAADFLVGMLTDSDDPGLSGYLVTLLAEHPKAVALLTAVVSNPEVRSETKEAAARALVPLTIPDNWQFAQSDGDSWVAEPDQEPLEIQITPATERYRTLAD